LALVAEAWARAAASITTATGDTLTVFVPAPGKVNAETLSSVKETFGARGLSVAHSSGREGFTLSRTNMPGATTEDEASGTLHWTGNARSTNTDQTTDDESAEALLGEIFDMLALLVRHQSGRQVSPENLITAVSFVLSLLTFMGYKP
jgi:hypothetical protein